MLWYNGDCSVLANYPEPDEPIVQQLVRAARPWLEVRTGRKHAEFSKAAQGGAEAVRAAAWVLYEQIMASKPTIEFDRTPRFHAGAQQVRTARDIMADRSANCLELALLFASCALRAQLDPLFIAVGAGKADHAFVGLWVAESSPKRNLVCGPDARVSTDAIPGLLGAGRIADAKDYWSRISEADMLVVDCSGAALGYPDRNGPQGLNFERSVTRAWQMLTSASSPLRCALDLRRARHKMPFPVRMRPDLIGREDDLEQVATAAASRNVVVSGWLGVGKTVLALQYAFEHQHEYPDGVFLLNAADEGRVIEQLADFARESGIDHHDRRGEPLPNLMLAALWVDKVVNKRGSRTLLIVDDVANAAFLSEQIAGLMSLSSLTCRLLVTTRNIDLLPADPDFENIVLLPLADEDATTLLLSMLPLDRQDKPAGLRVCKQLENLPLLVRIAGLTLSEDKTLSLVEYEQKLNEEDLRPIALTPPPSDYPERVTVVLSRAWQGLAERAAGPRDVLKLLSILPRNESVPFELLALMVELGDDIADERVRIDLVRAAAAELSATGLAEQPEEDAVRILHPMVHKFAADKANVDPKFIERALSVAADRLHEPEFYRTREEKDLIRFGEQLRLLREPSRVNLRLFGIVCLFSAQLDYLRQGYDALAQLALQARLDGGDELAEVLESVRLDREGPWFRLRWHGSHEREHDPEAAGHSDAVSAVAVWPESAGEKGPTVAVSGAENGELIQWSMPSLKLQRRLANLGAPISGLCISPDGATVYASAWDGALRAVALDKGDQKEARILGRHAYPANDCAVDPEGRFVVSVSDDGTARVYSLPEGRLLGALQHAELAPLLRCAVARRSQSREPILITASRAGVVRAWNPLRGEELKNELDILPGPTRQPVSACALAPDGALAAVTTRHKVLLWNPHTGKQANLSTPEQYVADCCFSPDGRRLMLVGRSKDVVVYTVDKRDEENRVAPWYHWLTACAFGADGRLFFASDDGSVHSWKYDHVQARARCDGNIQGRPNWVNVFRAGDAHALSVSTDQTICRWDLANGRRERTIDGHANWVNAFAVSPDGEHVLSGTDSKDVIYWSLRGNRMPTHLTGFLHRANACAIALDGAIGLAAGEDSSLRLWSLEGDFEELNHLTDGHRAAVTACAISANRRHALSGGDDARVVLWDLGEGKIEKGFDGHEDRITAVIFPQDQSDTVLSSSWDGTVKCWNTQSGQLLKDFREHTDGVTSCGSAAGGVVFSVSLDRTLRRWNLAEGPSDMRIHLGHRLRGLVVVDPSGDMVLCSDMSGAVFLFDVMAGSQGVFPGNQPQ